MKRLIISSIVFIFMVSGFVNAGNTSWFEKKKQNFFSLMVSDVLSVNFKILQTRHHILAIQEDYQRKGWITRKQKQFLDSVTLKYEVEDFFGRPIVYNIWSVEYQIIELLMRVDIVPLKLIMSQGILESGWGQSSAALQTNNFWGITAKYSDGYYVTSNATTTYYLRNFKTPEAGIASYVHLLNTSYYYKKFRYLRMQCRIFNQPLDATQLSAGLIRWSELRWRYINEINFIMDRYINPVHMPYALSYALST